MYSRLLLFAVLLISTSFVRATVMLDQFQLRTGFGDVVGGSSNQKLAQTFRVGITGTLTQIRLAINCLKGGSYPVTVTIHTVGMDGLPTDTVLDLIRTDSSVFPELVDTSLTAFSLRVPVTRGEQLAVVIEAPSDAACEAFSSGGPVVYTDGTFVFQDGPDPATWLLVPFGGSLTFQTFVDDGKPALCRFQTANGANNDWVPNDVPVCRCLEDRQLAQQRCAFVLPNAIVFSEFPVNAQSTVSARWSVEPLNDAEMPISIDVRSLTGNLNGKTVVIHARKTLHSETVRTRYSADSPKTLDRMLFTIDDGTRRFQFASYTQPLK